MSAPTPTELPPAGLTWADYIARWVADCGGWLPLADQLIHRAGDAVEIPSDPQTVERGLRRLARRDHKLGGQYGRWMLRFFGVTPPVEPRVLCVEARRHRGRGRVRAARRRRCG